MSSTTPVAEITAVAPAAAAPAAPTTTRPRKIKSSDLVRDKDVKHQCCGCMEIRRGVLALQITSIVLCVIQVGILLVGLAMAKVASAITRDSTIWTTPDGSVQTTMPGAGMPHGGGGGETVNAVVDMAVTIIYIVCGITLAQAVVTVWGIVSVVNRNVAHFKVFAIINVVVLVVNAAATVFAGGWPYLAILLLDAYFAYVYFQYVDTMRAEKEALEALGIKGNAV
ncbi:hypothetical protein H9P43_009223 [Blastocladiella emersonii ATCC 22665]|nr:hypothetical protein H9P43_009223 [Blastocladiella emersonii ATCC 22665]